MANKLFTAFEDCDRCHAVMDHAQLAGGTFAQIDGVGFEGAAVIHADIDDAVVLVVHDSTVP